MAADEKASPADEAPRRRRHPVGEKSGDRLPRQVQAAPPKMKNQRTGQNIEISGGGLLPHPQIHLTRRTKKTELHLLLTKLNLSPCLAMSKLKNQPNLSRIKPTNQRTTSLPLKQLQLHWRL